MSTVNPPDITISTVEFSPPQYYATSIIKRAQEKRSVFLSSYHNEDTYFPFSVKKIVPKKGVVFLSSYHNEETYFPFSVKKIIPQKGVVLLEPSELPPYFDFVIEEKVFPRKPVVGLFDVPPLSDVCGEEFFYYCENDRIPRGETPPLLDFDFSIYQQYIRIDDAERGPVFEEDIITHLEEFSFEKPEVFKPQRYLTTYMDEMDALMLYKMSEHRGISDIIHDMDSPYIHIGTRINRVIYPTTRIQTRGKKVR